MVIASRSSAAAVAILCLCLAGAGCSGPASETPEQPSAAPGELTVAERQVVEAHQALIAAYERGSLDAFVALLEPSPETVVFHPAKKHRFAGSEEVRAGLVQMFERLGGATWTEAHTALTVRGDVAWITSHVLIESAALAEPFMGRGTEIWQRTDDRWLLVHAHWSQTPGV